MGQCEETENETIAPLATPFDMPPLERPKFPDRRVSISDCGAVEGGAQKNTEAFAKAIADCARGGGGHVVVPKGKWLTGTIHLQSRVDLHLEDGAEIVFSDQPEDYLPAVLVRNGGVEIYNLSPLIYARDCEDIAVTGHGTLEGSGKAWWKRKAVGSHEPFKMSADGVPVEQRRFDTPEKGIRPSFVSFVNCRRVLMEGFTITSGPAWTIHPVYCENVIIRRVNVDTHGPNNDGMDLDSCRNVLVEHCVFNTGDDCLVLKSGYNEDGWRVNKPTENVVMRHCTGKEGHGGLVIGSEMSGGVRNVFMHDCEFDGTAYAVRIKSRRDRGGFVENIRVRDVQAKNLERAVVLLTMDYSSDRQAILQEKPPVFRHMFFQHLTAESVPAAIQMSGLAQSPIEDVHFADMTVQAGKSGVTAQFIKNCTFERLDVKPPKRAAFDLTDASNIELLPATALQEGDKFLEVQGKNSSRIVIRSAPPPGDDPVYRLDDDVSPDAVTMQPLPSPTHP